MALMELFAVWEERYRCRQQTYDTGGEERVGRIGRVALTYIHCALLSRSVVSDSATPWTVARQAPPSMGFSRQDYWSGLPCPPPGDLPDPRIKSMSLMPPALVGGFFTTSAT